MKILSQEISENLTFLKDCLSWLENKKLQAGNEDQINFINSQIASLKESIKYFENRLTELN